MKSMLIINIELSGYKHNTNSKVPTVRAYGIFISNFSLNLIIKTIIQEALRRIIGTNVVE